MTTSMPDVTLVSELGLTRMDPDSETVGLLVGPRLGCERALDLRRRGDRVTRPREREEDPVARPVDLGAVVRARRLADELAHARARRAETLAEQVREAASSPRRRRRASVTVPAGSVPAALSRVFTRRV